MIWYYRRFLDMILRGFHKMILRVADEFELWTVFTSEFESYGWF
jgi:hypothetical protein